MSINSFLDADLTMPIIITFIILVVVLIFALPVGLNVAKKTNNNIYGDDEYEAIKEEKNAKIVAKRTTPHPLSPTVMINMVVFELENGNRIELAIKEPNTYGIMVEGDVGTLKYQGKKFVEFERGNIDEA